MLNNKGKTVGKPTSGRLYEMGLMPRLRFDDTVEAVIEIAFFLWRGLR